MLHTSLESAPEPCEGESFCWCVLLVFLGLVFLGLITVIRYCSRCRVLLQITNPLGYRMNTVNSWSGSIKYPSGSAQYGRALLYCSILGQGKLAFGAEVEWLSVVILIQTFSGSCHIYRCLEIRVVIGYVFLLGQIMYIFLIITLYWAILYCHPCNNE